MVEYTDKTVVNNIVEKPQVTPALFSNNSIVLCEGANAY